MTFIKTLRAGAAALAIGCASAASAAVTITVVQTNATTVTATATGSIDTSKLTFFRSDGFGTTIYGQGAYIGVGGPNITVNYWSGLSGPSQFGSNLITQAGGFSGAPFAIYGNPGQVLLPTNYVSGSAINSAAQWVNTTIAGLGLTEGQYVYTGNGESVTVHIGRVTAPAVPESSTWAMMLAGFVAIGRALRKRRSFVAAEAL